MKQSPQTVAAGPLAAFVLLALLWGYNWVVMKIALRHSGPLDFAVLRTGFGVLLLLGVLVAMRAPLAPRHVGQTMLVGLLQTTGFVGLISGSLALGEAGKSAVLAYTMPFWLIAIGWPLLGERLRGVQWVAVALALAGLVLVFEPWTADAGLASSGLALGAGICWAGSVVVFKRIPVEGRDALLSLTTWQMIYGLVPLVIVAVLVPERPVDWNGEFIATLGYNAIGGMAIATLLWLYILQRLPATISSFSSLVVPLVGVVSAWLQLGERPSPAEAAGMLVIVVALGLLLRAGRGRDVVAEEHAGA